MERKPLPTAWCNFATSWWNDPEQRNYFLYECNNPENVGGERDSPFSDYEDFHGPRTYSCWHKNEGMKYRCWSESKKIAECPMALTNTKPEVECERFEPEKAHPLKALVTKEELRKKFYAPNYFCITCSNCLE